MLRSMTSDEKSHYLALLNDLKESGHEMDRLGVPIEIQRALVELIDRCQADFDGRFQRH
jgi:hypothetical protein